MEKILFVGLGTTGGWRHADRILATALTDRGCHVEGYWPTFGRVSRLRTMFRPLSGELIEANAVRRCARSHASFAPDRVVVSSHTAALLLPARWRSRTIVWSDTPVALAREGPGVRALCARDRFVMSRVHRVAVQAQHSLPTYRSLFPDAADRIRFLPVPIDDVRPPDRARTDRGLIYAGNPWKKGLDLAVRAWRASGTSARLLVTGIEPAIAARFLAGEGIEVPENVELMGRIPSAEHRELSRSVTVYLSASRREEYGNSQLEALADGALLVSGPSTGTSEPKAIAERVDAGLVARSDAQLSDCVRQAFEMGAQARAQYQDRASAAISDYTRTGFELRLDEVLA